MFIGFKAPNSGWPNAMQRPMVDGSKFKFWKEAWNGSSSLEERFPHLAALHTNVNCTIAERISRSTGGTMFCGSWRREIRNGLEEREVSIVKDICSNLSIHDSRSELATNDLEQAGFKVTICNRRARIDRLPTMSNLVQRGINIATETYAMCNEASETCDHIFLRCSKVTEVKRVMDYSVYIDWHYLF
ncbi:hypothetical protein OSB04_024505 [Centaurea solstitialis]|uniref:Reverse transcriptase zinc-binding domain-containing protein n=1 Tax=Centaurea solstitialis TaxID=347529 RepID=A0AA38SLW1_9ASTR|nr:hypothetical protein OSB04_024505 [Centaurea solstitialis]